MATEATLAELVARIRADTSQLDRALADLPTKTKQSTDKMGVAFAGLRGAAIGVASALTTGAIVSYAKGLVDAAGRMNDLAMQTDFAIGSLGALNVILQQNGASVDQLASATAIMSTNISQAANGSKEVIEKFDRLGLSVSKLKALGTEEAFYEIVQSLAGVENQLEQTELARAIFGRGAATLLPTIRETNGALREQVEALKEANPEYEEAVKYLDGIGDKASAAATSISQYLTVALSNAAYAAAFLGNKLAEAFAKAQPGGGVGTGRLADAFNDDSTGQSSVADSFGTTSTTPRQKAAGSNAHLIKGTAKATKELSQTQKDGTRIIEMTRTAQERYDIEMQKASALLKAHAIDQDTFNRYQQKMQEEMDRSNDKVKVFAINVKDYLGDAFESALFDAENFGDGMSRILDGIARKIARQSIIDPLSDGLSGLINSAVGSFNLGGIFGGFRAAGGPVAGGASYVVGENGPEIFTPSVSGSITPNHKLGGQITVTNVFHISPGLEQTVETAIMRAAPFIEARAVAGTMQAIERGGAASRTVGRRST